MKQRSLGGAHTDGLDPVEETLERLTATAGILFVAGAGNDGPTGPDRPEAATLGSPAEAPSALAVGAVAPDDGLAGFSSTGPSQGDAALTPEITAPGVGIIAPRAQGAEPGEPVGDHYVKLSGTSMATPHVAGAPPGTYHLSTVVGLDEAGGFEHGFALVIEPEVTVTGDTTVTLDGRTAVRLQPGIQGRRTTCHDAYLQHQRTFADGASPNAVTHTFLAGCDAPLALAPTRRVTVGTFTAVTRWTLQAEAPTSGTGTGTGTVPARGDIFELLFDHPGRVPDVIDTASAATTCSGAWPGYGPASSPTHRPPSARTTHRPSISAGGPRIPTSTSWS